MGDTPNLYINNAYTTNYRFWTILFSHLPRYEAGAPHRNIAVDHVAIAIILDEGEVTRGARIDLRIHQGRFTKKWDQTKDPGSCNQEWEKKQTLPVFLSILEDGKMRMCSTIKDGSSFNISEVFGSESNAVWSFDVSKVWIYYLRTPTPVTENDPMVIWVYAFQGRDTICKVCLLNHHRCGWYIQLKWLKYDFTVIFTTNLKAFSNLQHSLQPPITHGSCVAPVPLGPRQVSWGWILTLLQAQAPKPGWYRRTPRIPDMQYIVDMSTSYRAFFLSQRLWHMLSEFV